MEAGKSLPLASFIGFTSSPRVFPPVSLISRCQNNGLVLGWLASGGGPTPQQSPSYPVQPVSPVGRQRGRFGDKRI